jgi:hypothetical protein
MSGTGGGYYSIGPGLKLLDLSHNGIGTEAAEHLAAALAAPGCALEHLLLRGNLMETEASLVLAASLTKVSEEIGRRSEGRGCARVNQQEDICEDQ